MSTTTKSAINLRPAPHRKTICEREMLYDVLLHGQVFGRLDFNLRGDRGDLPTPDGKKLEISEKSSRPISAKLWCSIGRSKSTCL